MTPTVDTVIIGAGWAGAVAARHLANAGQSVVVLEARDRIGGRAFTLRDNPGQSFPIDLGCSAIHGYNEGNPAKELAAQALVEVTLAKAQPRIIVGPEGPLPAPVQNQLKHNLNEAIVAARAQARDSIPPGTITLASSLLNPASALFTGLCERLTLTQVTQFAQTLEIPLGARLDEISMCWYGFEDNFAGSDGVPEGGFQNLLSKVFVAARNRGATVRQGEVVAAIEHTSSGPLSNVRVTTANGTYSARTVLCTIPLGVLQSKDAPVFEPSLPARRQAVIARTKVGALNKLVLSYPLAWWEPSDVGSFVLLPLDEPHTGDIEQLSLEELLRTTTAVVVAVSTEPKAMLMAMFGADHAIALERFQDSELQVGAHEYLVRRLVHQSTGTPPAPTHSYLTRWSKDPFSRGATTTPVQVGESRSPLDFAELAKPLWNGALGFAGEHTSLHNRGSIAGAVESGLREAKRIERLLRFWEGLEDHAQ